MSSRPGVLVVEDGSSPYTLAALRALDRAGYRAAVASPVLNPRLVRSRALSAWHQVRLPEDDLDGFAADVAAAVSQGDHQVVHGADDVELLALSACRERLGAALPLPAHDDVLRAVDKLTLTQAAWDEGLAAPATRPATPAALEQVDGPVVVKARLHWTPGGSAVDRHLPVALCPDAATAARQVDALQRAGGAALLQEPVSGEQLALSLVLDGRGGLLAVSQQRTERSALHRTSSRAVTTQVEQELLDGALRLLRALRWTGIANLQFLRPPGGRPHLIDLNGRFYGSLALAVAAGADLPTLSSSAALGALATAAPARGRPGVRFQALLDDLRRARVERRGGLVTDVAQTLGYAVGAVHTTWSWRDPRPGIELGARLLLRRR